MVYAAPPEIIQLDNEVGVDSPNWDVTWEGAPNAEMPMTDASTTKKHTSVMIRVCHSRSRLLSCMYIHDDFLTESRYSYLCCRISVP